MTTTIERVRVRIPVPAEALSPAEQDTLLLHAASVEKVAKVPSPSRRAENRAWSMGGNVD